MTERFRQALIDGYENLTAWADLLDRINVFPVADGDTGRNLVISLSPLHHPEGSIPDLKHALLFSARGNSGNIASAFFQAFILGNTPETLSDAVRQGRKRAWQAVPDPRPGTMLTFFDSLSDCLQKPWSAATSPEHLSRLETSVRETASQQPKLKEAGVVDAGALGMYLFFSAFMAAYAGAPLSMPPVTETFGPLLRISPSYREEQEAGYCVDTVLKTDADPQRITEMLATLGESVIANREENCLKLHFHTPSRDAARKLLAPCGEVMTWTEDDLLAQTSGFNREPQPGAVHIMTDAAGSITREEAKAMGITLLDSYVTLGGRSLPETYLPPGALYDAMRSGVRVTTSQASVFERHRHYQSVLACHDQVLYLCVGSAYTGNYHTVMDWKKENDPQERLTVIDTGAASGRLAVTVLATAALAGKASGIDEVVTFAQNAIERSEEYIFLDRLEYLAAGGRLSKTGAFFGDLLHMKPVVTPLADGATKAGLCRNRRDQEGFAWRALAKSLAPREPALILLEYSDNLPQVEAFSAQVQAHYPQARVMVHPLSLTAGTHMGPGTWAVAFLPGYAR
jgi:DegV family protein with EDD domain